MAIKYFKRKRWLVLPVAAALVFALTQLFTLWPELVERYYAQKIYPLLATILSFFSSWIPFSLDDLLYVVLILSGILIVVLLFIRKISWKKSAKIVLNALAVVYILFYVLWGFNYFRSDLNTRLGIHAQQPGTDKFVSTFEHLIEKTNASWYSFENFDQEETDRLVERSYKKLAPVLQLNYPSGVRKAKKITFSGFFAKAGISGYYGPFLNEVHLNKNLLPVEYPFVLAHEKAHQFGVTSEAEANFYAWLVCSQSPSKHLQYSANLAILRYFAYHGRQLEQFPEIIGQLDERAKSDIRKIREHWQKLRNAKIDRAATKVNDTYLKTNKVEKGIDDYGGVVKFVMDFSLDTAFRKKHHLISN